MDLATLRSNTSSVSNSSSSNSGAQKQTDVHLSDAPKGDNFSNTIKSFNSNEPIIKIEGNQDISLTEDMHDCAINYHATDNNLNRQSDQFLKPETKAVRGSGPRALRRRPGKHSKHIFHIVN